jgi:hypothetical protein
MKKRLSTAKPGNRGGSLRALQEVFDASLHFLSRHIRHQAQISGFRNQLMEPMFVAPWWTKSLFCAPKMGDPLHFRLNGIRI